MPRKTAKKACVIETQPFGCPYYTPRDLVVIDRLSRKRPNQGEERVWSPRGIEIKNKHKLVAFDHVADNLHRVMKRLGPASSSGRFTTVLRLRRPKPQITTVEHVGVTEAGYDSKR